MRPSSSSLFPLFLLPLTNAISIDCANIVEDKQHWDLSSLGGPHQVHELERIQSGSDSYRNTTYTIDICQPLKQSGTEKCSSGTRVCATKRVHLAASPYDPQKPIPSLLPPAEEVFSIAGEYTHSHGRHLDPIPKRLRGSESHADDKQEGVRITFHGGLEENHEGLGRVTQKAVVEFICDKDRTGLEGPGGSGTDGEDKRRRLAPRADDGKGDKPNDGEDDGEDEGDGEGDGDGDDEDEPTLPPMKNPDAGASLQFVSYNIDAAKKEGTLRLEWRTRYACEDSVDNPDDDAERKKKNGGWGFFTWFIIILFLSIAAYLIFGSWLNYNRYGARGWDLLPHGDTIRDVPYLLKEWGRRVFGGAGNLGGSRDLGYIRV